MAIAAVPAYLGRDFSSASPGMRFGMYLALWGMNNRTRERLWATYDINHRVAGRNHEEREFRDENKTLALKQAIRLTKEDRQTMGALAIRQATVAAPLHGSRQLLRIEAQSVAPFATGLGNEHPLENGFAFLNPYGLPYLPGSGVKGVLRQASHELASGEWDEHAGWDDERRYILQVEKKRIPVSMSDVLFGKESGDGDTDHVRGALSFWDVYPQLSGDALQVEVMTPHQTHYYQHGESPHESGSPNPIDFLTVPPGSGFAFHVQCDRPFLARLAPDLADGDRWQDLLRAAFAHAFAWLGFGAKTAVGYGALRRDEAAEEAAVKARAAREQADREANEAARRALEREAALAALSPVERAIQEFVDTRPDKNQSEISAVMGEVKRGRWQGDEKMALARWLRDKMQATKGQWKETSHAKKPEKDKEFQNTLLVKQWLAGK